MRPSGLTATGIGSAISEGEAGGGTVCLPDDLPQTLCKPSLDDDQASNIVAIDLRGKSPLADHMVIASGRSTRHVSSIVEKAGRAASNAKGMSCPGWRERRRATGR